MNILAFHSIGTSYKSNDTTVMKREKIWQGPFGINFKSKVVICLYELNWPGLM